jgi:hypothetical protein
LYVQITHFADQEGTILHRHHLAILILPAVFGGSAAFATAQAESTPEWKLAPPGEAIGPELPVQVVAKAETALTLTTKIIGSKVEVACEKASLSEALLEAGSKGKGQSPLRRLQNHRQRCRAGQLRTESGRRKGAIATVEVKSQLSLHEGETLVRLEPMVGETFATSESTESCAIGEKIPIKGILYVKETGGKFRVNEATHVVEEGTLTTLFVISNTAEHKATVAGKVSLTLTGEHFGSQWSGLG